MEGESQRSGSNVEAEGPKCVVSVIVLVEEKMQSAKRE